MNTKGAELLLHKMGFKYTLIYAPQSGYRNRSYKVLLDDGSAINLIIYKSEPEIVQKIRAANVVSNSLADVGLPTRKTLSKVVRFNANRLVMHACAYTYLPGQTLPWEGWNQKHLKLLGWAMAEIHKGVNAEAVSLPCVVDVTHQDLAEMCTYFKSESVRKALHTKLNVEVEGRVCAFLHKLLARLRKSKVKEYVLHMDLVRGNVLFSTDLNAGLQLGDVALSGLLDFEKVARGPVLFDLARTLAFLLIDCKYKSAEKVRKYFLVSGYTKRGRMKIEGQRDLEGLVLFYLLYDFYKFLVHNPFEHLVENEHFMRTRNLLITKKALVIKS